MWYHLLHTKFIFSPVHSLQICTFFSMTAFQEAEASALNYCSYVCSSFFFTKINLLFFPCISVYNVYRSLCSLCVTTKVHSALQYCSIWFSSTVFVLYGWLVKTLWKSLSYGLPRISMGHFCNQIPCTSVHSIHTLLTRLWVIWQRCEYSSVWIRFSCDIS